MITRPLARLAAWSLIAAAFAACTTSAERGDEQYVTSGEPIIEGTAEAVGALNFLNDETTTFELLDDDVPLHRGAAENLIAHRNGPDGIFGTEDDDLFDSLKEVLDVDQVGEKRLEKIAAYAASQGFVPQGDDLLGVYDDVSFTVNEAKAVLEVANLSSYAVLDDEVPLDKRAADGIVAQRPFITVHALAQVGFVGTSALTRLKAFAVGDAGAPLGEACIDDTGCQAGLFCHNITFDENPTQGRCADANAPLGGVEQSCKEYEPCQEGLTCMGVTVYDGNGYCREADAMAVREVTVNETIPSGGTLTKSIVINTLRTVPEDVVIDLDIDHPRKEDLTVVLTAASNTSTTLWAGGDANPPSYITETWGIERDNEVNGTWTVTITDNGQGVAGHFNGFTLTVTSRYD